MAFVCAHSQAYAPGADIHGELMAEPYRPDAAEQHLREAIDHVDAALGAGYAAKHPELIAAFMLTSTIASVGSVISGAIDNLATHVEERVLEVGKAKKKVRRSVLPPRSPLRRVLISENKSRTVDRPVSTKALLSYVSLVCTAGWVAE